MLPQDYLADPWGPLDKSEHPDRWDDRIPLLLLPVKPEHLDEQLGRWLKDHLQSGRNTVRFLVPQAGTANVFLDRNLIVLARGST